MMITFAALKFKHKENLWTQHQPKHNKESGKTKNNQQTCADNNSIK
jgi:hypothetical protein